MSVSIFDTIKKAAKERGVFYDKTSSSNRWFRERAIAVSRRDGKYQVLSDKSRAQTANAIEPGQMYMFMYDAKHKATLPYYDLYPVIFPFDIDNGKIYGLNLHYLPIYLRGELMDKLWRHANDKRYPERTYLRINYELLKASSRLKAFKPCIKQYIFSHINSQISKINADEWNMALFLPFQEFVSNRYGKISEHDVYRDSIKKIK